MSLRRASLASEKQAQMLVLRRNGCVWLAGTGSVCFARWPRLNNSNVKQFCGFDHGLSSGETFQDGRTMRLKRIGRSMQARVLV